MSVVDRIISAALRPIKARIRTLVTRGLVELVKDDKKMQALQVSGRFNFLRDDVERFQQFGFTSHPPVGAECIMVMVGGKTDHPVVIAVDDRRHRPKDLAEGEVALYQVDETIRILLKADGKVLIGTTPAEFATRDDRNQIELKALRDYVRDHVHPAPTASGGVGVSGTLTTQPTISAIVKPASPPPEVGATACDEVKIK